MGVVGVVALYLQRIKSVRNSDRRAVRQILENQAGIIATGQAGQLFQKLWPAFYMFGRSVKGQEEFRQSLRG